MTEKDINRGDRLRQLREEENLTQEQLGKEIGTSGSHVSKWEGGDGISRKYLIKLSKVLDTTIDFIETGARPSSEKEASLRQARKKVDAVEESVTDYIESGLREDDPQILLEHAERLIRIARIMLQDSGDS